MQNVIILLYICGFQSNSNAYHIDGLVQERRNPIARALELRHSSTNLLIYLSLYHSAEKGTI